MFKLKWKNKASPISDINHYIKCCEDIEKKKKLNGKNVYHLYGTKVPVSGPSLQALSKLKISENKIKANPTTLSSKLNQLFKLNSPFKEKKLICDKIDLNEKCKDKFNQEYSFSNNDQKT